MNDVWQQFITFDKPVCRRGEGFADQLGIEKNRINGRAVPYNHVIELMPGLYEVFEKGSFSRQEKDPSRVKICLEHGQIVGKVNALQEKDSYLHFSAAISTNPGIPEAVRAQALVDDELVDEMSIGFQTVKDGTAIEDYNGGKLMRHTRARLLEISIVPWGAYGREATLSRSRLIDPMEEFKKIKQKEAREWVDEFRKRVT